MNAKQTTLDSDKSNYSENPKKVFPARIQSFHFQLQVKDAFEEKLDNPNKSKDLVEKDKTSLVPNLRQNTDALFTRQSITQNSDTNHRFSSKRTFGHLRQNLSYEQLEVSKSEEYEGRQPIRVNPRNISRSIASASLPDSNSLKHTNRAKSNKIYPRRRGSHTLAETTKMKNSTYSTRKINTKD
eukprot:TRINITY_DN8666_c0_g1_i1.p1 TRINITY_DN8666_c0_g1~~TRINITY_DN8666_c0_g1_i1.p1  ORF type:complete len:212 (-),score=35.99 TRINITY_DN8666_c0_g1_i1:3-554(-)